MAVHSAERPVSASRETLDGMGKLLGWFSVGLGVAELVAPRDVARAIGAGPEGAVLPFFGARGIAAGLGILGGKHPGEWLWGRVAGDALDLAFLWSSYQSQTDEVRRSKLMASMAAVAGVAMLDIVAASLHMADSDA